MTRHQREKIYNYVYEDFKKQHLLISIFCFDVSFLLLYASILAAVTFNLYDDARIKIVSWLINGLFCMIAILAGFLERKLIKRARDCINDTNRCSILKIENGFKVDIVYAVNILSEAEVKKILQSN